MRTISDENYGGSASVCLCCGGAVQKVSAIWRAGTMNSTSQVFVESMGSGHGFDRSHGVGFTQTQTRLAALFSPPDVGDGGLETQNASASGSLLLYLAVAVYLLGVQFTAVYQIWISGRDYSTFECVCYFLLAFCLFVPYTIHTVRDQKNRYADRIALRDNVRRWRVLEVAAQEKWGRLNYCPSCDHVTDPATGAFSPADRIQTFVYDKR